MNTNEVAKEIGVSSKTIQRWVKQLNIPVARNELGHYEFHEDIVQLLKQVKQQMNEGVLLQEVQLPFHEETVHQLSATIETDASAQRLDVLEHQLKQLIQQQSDVTAFEKRLCELEQTLSKKADEGVSYQLLQHRREIEELTATLERLTKKVDQSPTVKEEKDVTHTEIKKKRALFPLFHSFR
ncbi:chromosome-anchoring protein RacA [Bacillus sp. 179-C3.3 HS]|uniref:chromosome-anchoring protein RacA n=1 Tax=Bacillus sp. 179-C3.3 HS TaxID=3232162 RepID=UPI0039A31DF6